MVVVTTNGENPEIVEKILAILRGYHTPGRMEVRILAEERDRYPYSAAVCRVPGSYGTPRGSQHKLRALHWFATALASGGFGAETYVVHLDDDSVPSEGYIDYVFRMRELAGQGNIRLRSHGIHLLSTLADFVRIGDCDAWCDTFNLAGRPMAVHGEGLVIRADIETRIQYLAMSPPVS